MPYIASLDPSLVKPAANATAQTASATTKAGGKRNSGPVAVSVAAATDGTLPVQRSTIGAIVAAASTQLSNQIAGTVAQILVQDGAEVKKGDLLVKLDDRTISAQIAKDTAQIAKDQATVDDAQASYARTKHLVDTGVTAAQAGDDALTAVKVAQGTLAVDQATHAMDQVQLCNTEVRAPFDGRLGAVQFSVGAYVPTGTALVRITQMKPVLVQFSLPESDLALLRQTATAGTLTVSVSAVLGPNEAAPVATGPVTFIDNTVDPASSTVTLRAALANEDETLWPGQPVNVTVQAGTSGPLVLVPNVAVMPHADGSVVYVVKADKTVEQRVVTVALRKGDVAGIGSGLKAGEQVIVEGQAAVLPGSAVKLVAPKAKIDASKQGQAELDPTATGGVTKS
ncbi:MAG: efflux RND transporter periplasmic adaptor subunit [Rhodobacteraceae bacterium]|nr:efflux RND transporter periplasmic adaptor subunit [Paracoccaceae bacterium]